MANNTTLYEVVKEYQNSNCDAVFSENDLFCIEMHEGTPCYVSVVENALAGYLGEKGITGYLRLCFQDPEAPFLQKAELENSQECFIVTLNNSEEDLEKEDMQAMNESGVSFDLEKYPLFRIKRQYHFPWFLTKEDEEDLLLMFQGILFAKNYFAQFGKISRTNSLNPWLESLGLEDGSSKEYFPYLKKEADGFSVSARELSDDDYGVVFPQAHMNNEEKRIQYKTMKAKPGKVLYYATFLYPEPFKPSKGSVPVFPVVSMIFDPQKHELLDLFMVDDYEEDHIKCISRLLEVIEQVGKPQALHCFGERSFPLLSKLGEQIGIKVMQGKRDAELEALMQEFVFQGSEEDQHVHGPDCSCDHHGSSHD